MDEDPKRIVDISLAKIATGEIDKERQTEKQKKLVFLVCMTLIVTLAVYFHEPLYVIDPKTQQPQTIVDSNGDVQVLIRQNEYGHYLFAGEINGKEVKFLLDTGATTLAIPAYIANYLGLVTGDPLYGNTANGVSKGYQTTAGVVKVGGIVLSDVEAAILPNMKGDHILLGMSFLKNLSIQQDEGQITITQKNGKGIGGVL
jgi:aspartyl protease family protein